MTPQFLDLDDVLESHAEQIAAYGGSEGIRDAGLLQSAVAQPAAMFDGDYLHVDLFEMAAAYLFHLVQTIRLLMETSASAWNAPYCFSRSTAVRSRPQMRRSPSWCYKRPRDK